LHFYNDVVFGGKRGLRPLADARDIAVQVARSWESVAQYATAHGFIRAASFYFFRWLRDFANLQVSSEVLADIAPPLLSRDDLGDFYPRVLDQRTTHRSAT
jgi:hypothetical protein